VSACSSCLRRSHLIGHLAPRIASLLGRPSARIRGVLALDEHSMVDAVAGPRAAEAWRFLERFDPEAAAAEARERGLAVVCRHSGAYPERLARLGDPPAVLYCAGRAALPGLLAAPTVAVVGTRRASPYGLEMAQALGRGLGAAGVTVVSGLALGVDAAAHRAALEGGGRPLAVLAGGADVPYPKRNRRLYERVREAGTVLSEMPPGRPPLRWSFPARNRLMAGLAQMTVVVEAANPSGSLITAEFAQDLGLAVGAVPGRATARTAAGTNALLRDGARLIAGPEDVLDELFGVGCGPRPPPAAGRALSPELGQVLEAVEAGNGLDGIAEVTGLGSGAVRAALARLEASGHVRRAGLASYERSAVP
jgi:DNA processing protein